MPLLQSSTVLLGRPRRPSLCIVASAHLTTSGRCLRSGSCTKATPLSPVTSRERAVCPAAVYAHAVFPQHLSAGADGVAMFTAHRLVGAHACRAHTEIVCGVAHLWLRELAVCAAFEGVGVDGFSAALQETAAGTLLRCRVECDGAVVDAVHGALDRTRHPGAWGGWRGQVEPL